MIKKESRLVEREIRRVLKFRKPFFSYAFVANVATNRLGVPRFAPVLSSKSVTGSVGRNFFRRRAYELARPYLSKAVGIDVVVVAKKGSAVLDHRNADSVASFDRELRQLYQKVFSD